MGGTAAISHGLPPDVDLVVQRHGACLVDYHVGRPGGVV